jgi:hypothetical protein
MPDLMPTAYKESWTQLQNLITLLAMSGVTTITLDNLSACMAYLQHPHADTIPEEQPD